MIEDSPLALPEDRIEDLVENLGEMRTILEDICSDLEGDEENDYTDAIAQLWKVSDILEKAAEELDAAGSLID